MRRWTVLFVVAVLAACGGDGGDRDEGGSSAAGSAQTAPGPASDTTAGPDPAGADANAGAATTVPATGATDPAAGPADGADAATSASGSADCLVGRYELDGTGLFAQVAAASGGGAGQIVGGAVVLDLRVDGTAALDFQGWSFRLSFPGEAETVLGTQNGTAAGSWGFDEEDEQYWIELVNDAVTATFVLESANGPVPVPAGGTLTMSGRFPIEAACPAPTVVIPATDAQTGAVINWTFSQD